MTSAERAKLRSLAMTIEPTTHIGKNGVGDTLIKQIDEQLESRELIKISVLKNAGPAGVFCRRPPDCRGR